MFFAVDAQERVHAACYLVWTKKYAYYIMGGGDSDLRSSGAAAYVLWEAIKFAAGVSEVFDFEGSMIEPVERFVRCFGALQRPYFSVTRNEIKVRDRILWKLNSVAHSVFGGTK